VNGYLTLLQLRGPGIYDEQEQIWERTDATAEASFGEQVQTYDMPYQSDADVGEGAALYLLDILKADRTHVGQVTINANRTATQMTQALAREPGDRIGLAEALTGLATTTGFFIQGCAGEYLEGGIINVSWSLAPSNPQAYWLLGATGRSELGTAGATVLGF
jgi:hypothetical protein